MDNKENKNCFCSQDLIKIKTENINFFYGKQRVLKNINLDILANKITAIIGPSGCGKTTFIRLLNRMHELTPNITLTGRIYLDGQDILSPSVNSVEIRRRIGMVFQKPNPFPKSIFKNISYGLEINGIKNKEFIEERVIESLKNAALWDEVKNRLYDNALKLSGGQQQRLCIARALAVKPEVLLFDEPCASLDPISTRKIEELMLELKKDYTIVVVTHNMQQAARVSDYTGFFLMGELIEFDTTKNIFEAPKNPKTEDYITGKFG